MTDNSNSYLTQNETDDSHGGAQEGSKHEELETVDDTFVELTAGRRHGRQRLPFGADVTEDAVDDVTEEEKIDAS